MIDDPAAKAATLMRLIEAGKKARASYDKAADEVDRYIYFDDNFKSLYQDTDPNLSFYSRISLMRQAVDMFIPMVVTANPHRMGKMRQPNVNPLTKIRKDLMQDYLNYTPQETCLYDENILAANQAIAHGRGVWWTGWNPKKKLIQSVWDSDKNLILDPDAKSRVRLNWCARKREKPRWEVEALYPQSAAAIADMKPIGNRPTDGSDSNSQMVCYYEVYMRAGLHHYNSEAHFGDATDTPVKYIVTEQSKLLAEMPWEIPWFMDDDWPFTEFDPLPCPGSVWPNNPLQPGLGHQEALNYLYTDFIAKFRASAKIMMAVMTRNGEKPSDDAVADLFRLNERFPIIEINATGALDQAKISDYFQQLKIDAGINEFQAAYQIIKNEFAEHTGLYAVLHAGHQDAQSRSSREADMKDRNSRTRIDAMHKRFEEAQSKLARKEAIAARFMHTPDEIANILGPEAGQMWGTVMPPQDAMMNPNAVNFEQFFRETDYTIETGSTRRPNIDRQLEVFEQLNNQVTSVQISSPDPAERAMAYQTIAENFKLLGLPDELVQKQRERAMQLEQMAMAMAMQPPVPQGAPA